MEHNASVRGLWAKGHFTASSKRSIQLGLAPPCFGTTFELFSPWRDIFEHPFYSTLYPTHLHNRLNQMLKYWFSTFFCVRREAPLACGGFFDPSLHWTVHPSVSESIRLGVFCKTSSLFNLDHFGFHSVVYSSSSISPSPSLRSGHCLGHFAFQSVLKLTRRFPPSFWKMTAEKS